MPTGFTRKENPMTRATHMSDTSRWWFPVGLAGATTAATIVTMFLAIPASSASPAWPPPDTGGAAGTTSSTYGGGSAPCFDHELTWDVALDGPIPTCDPPATVPPLGIVGTRLHVAPGGDDGFSVDRPTGFINQIRWTVARP